jgi:hypothetical protein
MVSSTLAWRQREVLPTDEQSEDRAEAALGRAHHPARQNQP